MSGFFYLLTLLTYSGLSPRETIIFNSEDSPYFDRAYEEMKGSLREEDTEQEILTTLLFYVREKMFDPARFSLEKVHELVATQSSDTISLDTFIQEKTGVCRHTAFATSLMIDRLIQENILTGRVFLVREELFCGRHAWSLFISETGSWFVDAFWNLMENAKNQAGLTTLLQKYGTGAVTKYAY